MMITIHQPQYLPWLGYFDKINKADIFILLDNVQFKKNEWQNRNRIKTDQGWQWLTVPVLHDFGQNINQTRINNTQHWGKKHLNALELNYAKAPFFKEYFHGFEGILSKPWDNLSQINIALIVHILGILGITTKVHLASEYEATQQKTLRLIELCKHFQAQQYLSGEGGEAYLQLDQFRDNNIEVIVQKYQHPLYNQCWMKPDGGGFVSHLSIVDLIFNSGPESLKILSSKGLGP